MAERDAKVRLNLAAAGMLTMLQQLAKESQKLADEMGDIGDEAKKTEKKIHPALQSAKDGLTAAKKSALDLGNQLKSTLGHALTLGGALSTGAGIASAIDLTSRYRDMAFAIRTATGEAMSYEQVQQIVEGTAGRWKQANAAVAESFDELFRETNNVEFAKKATEAVAQAARASGQPIKSLTTLAVELGDKFGVAGDDIGDALATVVGTGKIEEIAGGMDAVGAAARSLGLTGKDGLEKFIGMLELSGGATKDLKKALAGLSGVMEALEDPDRLKNIEKTFKVKLKNADGTTKSDALQQLIGATGGQKEELAKFFNGDSLKIMTEYGKIYDKAFTETAGTFKEKSDAGMKAFNDALADSAKSKLDAKGMKDAAEDRLKDPKAQLEDAMNKFTNAFAQPKLISAVEKLADKAPKLAETFASLIDFAADHPILAGAGLVAAKPAMAFGQSVAGDALQSVGKKVGKEITEYVGATAIGKKIAASAATGGVWSHAGKALGAAGAGVIAFAITKAIVDARMDAKEKNQNDAVVSGVNADRAMRSGDQQQMKKAEASLKAKIAKMEEDRTGVGGFFDRVMVGAARTFTSEGDKFESGDTKILRQSKKELAELQAAMAKGAGSGDKAADALAKVATGADKVAQVFAKFGGGSNGTNGLPGTPPNGNGSYF